jgi:hypothetical protein
MPIYPFYCVCGRTKEEFRHVAEYDRPCVCDCGSAMSKDFSALQPAYLDVPFDSVDYDVTGKPFHYSTRGQLKAYAKAHGKEVEFGVSNRNHGEGRRR